MRKHILIIEPTPEVRLYTIRELTRLFSLNVIVHAIHREEGRRILRDSATILKIDLTICGEQVERWEDLKALHAAPFVVSTAQLTPALLRRAQKAGVVVLERPFVYEDLMKVIVG